MFATGTANVTCIDMLLPPGGGFAAPGSRLFYTRASQQLVSDYSPTVRAAAPAATAHPTTFTARKANR